MRLTFVVLFACWTIYSSSIAVLSLPPSLIADAASLQQRQNAKPKRESPVVQAHFDALWHKDAPSNTEDDIIARDVVRPRNINANSNSNSNSNGNDNENDNGNVVQFNINNNNNKNNNSESSIHDRSRRMSELASGATAALLDPRLELQLKLVEAAAAADAAYDLNGFLQATAAADIVANDKNNNNNEKDNNDDGNNNNNDEEIQSMEVLPLLLPPQETAARDANEFFTPLKYWARHCQPDKNCPKQYYRALFGNRNNNKAAAALGHPNQLSSENNAKNFGGIGVDEVNSVAINRGLEKELADDIRKGITEYYDDTAPLQKMNEDIFMFLNGEQDLMKFLRWAMHLLYPRERFANYTANDAEYYHPGMYIWKKLNLSGNVQPPLFVDEPRYIIVRREQLNDDFKINSNYNNNDPFIPPRGRKQNMPNLDALLHRYETFVPNRGKRDKIKDMLKSDDLFFPNRGKKLRPPTPTTMKRDLEYESKSSSNKNGNRLTNTVAAVDITTSYDDDAADWKTTLPVVLVMRDVLGKLFQRKLQKLKNHAAGNKITTNAHEINNAGDDHPEWLETMLNYKFNDNDPSVRQSMPTAVAINGETSEMSTLQKIAAASAAAAKSHALLELKRNAVETTPTDATLALTNTDIGVDSGGTKIGANRLLSTRSMSTAMAQQRQQQQQQLHQRQRQQQRHHLLPQQSRLAAMSQQFDADNNIEHANWHQLQEDSSAQHPHARQVKSFNNFDPWLWRQLQLTQQQPTDSIQHLHQQYRLKRQPQQGFGPQEIYDWVYSKVQSNAIDKSPYTDFATAGNVANNDYNYFDI